MAGRNGKRPRRRGRFGFLYKLLSVLLILGAIVAGCIVFFRVEDLSVLGSTVYTAEEIVAAAGVEQGDNLFLIRTVQTAHKIRDRLPYVDTVNLRRVLPDALVITVTECTPVGAIQAEDGSWWVVDKNCKLLEKGSRELLAQYPQIAGLMSLMPSEGDNVAVAAEERAKLDSLKQVLSALEEREMIAAVGSLDLSGVAEIHMLYDGRFQVRLPMYSDDFHLLIHTLQEAANYLDAGQSGTMDLTGKQARFIPD